MLTNPQPPRIHLPKGWQDCVKSAVLHAIALAHYAIVYARAWAADSINARVRLATENDRLHEACTLLREEIRIKDTLIAQIAPQRRPHYGPHERMAILELRAARGWSLKQTADTFLVTQATISSWVKRIDDQGAKALLQLREPVNKFPDFVRYIVQRLKTLPCLTMKDLVFLLIHLLTTLAKLLGPGGAKAIVADSLLMKQQLLVISRSRKRAPNLSMIDRFLLGFWSLFLSPHHIRRSAIIIRPSTLLRFHEALKRRKYRLLYTSRKKGKPGPKGPSQELILLIVEMKRRNPGYGCPKIAEQISKLFGIDIDKDVVRRILDKHYHPDPDTDGGPSWLTFIGHMKDSLWSVDLFRCESILLKTHWVLLVMDQFTRRIIGFGVHVGDVDGVALCRMFNSAVSNKGTPTYLSSDNDPLFEYYRWRANLRTLDIEEIKSIPYKPVSPPFIERLIGTVRRDFLDQTLFWNAVDLERKLTDYQAYYNIHRTHRSLGGDTPAEVAEVVTKLPITLNNFRWQTHCRGIFQLPIAA